MEHWHYLINGTLEKCELCDTLDWHIQSTHNCDINKSCFLSHSLLIYHKKKQFSIIQLKNNTNICILCHLLFILSFWKFKKSPVLKTNYLIYLI